MNTKVIQDSEKKVDLYFPELGNGKYNVVVSKHFCNLGLWLPPQQMSLLMWLVYQRDAEGNIIYNTRLLEKYSASIKQASKLYRKSHLNTTVKLIRAEFKALIELGILEHQKGSKMFIINRKLIYDKKINIKRG